LPLTRVGTRHTAGVVEINNRKGQSQMPYDRRASDRQYNLVGRKRNPDSKFHASAEWRKLSILKRQKDPLCEHCLLAGKTVPAEQVDHKIPPRGDFTLQRAWTNLVSVCASYHSHKTRIGKPRPYSNEVGLDGYPIDPRHPANLTREERTKQIMAKVSGAGKAEPEPEPPASPTPRRFKVF
jgi:5-methylcytosine-specific restriction protein A